MKSLRGQFYEDLVATLGGNGEKHYYSPETHGDFSVFVDDNEFLFVDEKLFSIEITNFDTATKIPGFDFPVETRLEKLLTILTEKEICWEVFDKYSREHWIVVRLKQHCVLYEFEFIGETFTLRYVRLQSE
ncbi:hypothetical protein [Blastopirellula marina]|uniref:Uncharacterized protein n=1 Tax=Blastopirellula marina TaxID=124 RepID=A0A2S8GTA0_9BACT|nr:hypothetical protein [Blastopirellula marina]PQO47657.1 hypothetical protein C5Y93_03095 [Blastopirellula marina]